MIVKPATIGDYEDATKLYDKFRASEFGIPSPERLIASRSALDDDGNLIAFGTLVPLIESILVIDNDRSLKEKTLALRQLLLEAIKGVSDMKQDGIHAFVQDPIYANSLKKHFGFRTCKGEALYLGV